VTSERIVRLEQALELVRQARRQLIDAFDLTRDQRCGGAIARAASELAHTDAVVKDNLQAAREGR